MIKILKNPKTPAYRELKEFVLGETFPWMWSENNVVGKSSSSNFGIYTHALISRPDDGSGYVFSKKSSPYAENAYDVVREILDYNNLFPRVLYRLCVNCVHPTETNEPSMIHVDHMYPHTNLLIYLKDTNGGDTFVEGEPFPGREDDVILFEGKHNHKPPKSGRRIVIVATMLFLDNDLNRE